MRARWILPLVVALAAVAARLTPEERLATQQLVATCTASDFLECGEPTK